MERFSILPKSSKYDVICSRGWDRCIVHQLETGHPSAYDTRGDGPCTAPNPVQTDNTTALGFVSKTLQPKSTKSADMRCWWMRDRSNQQQFRYYCISKAIPDTISLRQTPSVLKKKIIHECSIFSFVLDNNGCFSVDNIRNYRKKFETLQKKYTH